MSQKMIKWLYRQLPELVAKGVLPAEASERIHQHYGEVKEVSRKTLVLFFCGVVGAVFIGLGIILLLAHNWEDLSRTTRAVLSFVPLVLGQGLALWVLLKRPASAAFKEASAAFLSLMVAASIALVCQTYNIHGDTGTFVMTWMLLILPVVYLMEASLPAAIFLIGITSWTGGHWNDQARALFFWPLAACVVPHFLWSLRREAYALRSTILAFVMFVCVPIGAGVSLGRALPGSWVMVFPSIYAIFYLLGKWSFQGVTTHWQRPWRVLGGLGLFVMALQYTFRFMWKHLTDPEFTIRTFGVSSEGVALVDQAFVLVVLLGAVLLFYDALRRRDVLTALFGVLPLLAMAAYSLRGEMTTMPLILFNGYLFVLSVSHIILGGQRNSLATVNLGMLMLAILIITRFFDSDIGFILKGLVFIAVGIGFLATNVWLMRSKGGAR